METVRCQIAEIRERREENRALQSRSLDEKIRDWYSAMPPQERRHFYTMDQFVLLFNTAPGLIGKALHRLGWERQRRWSGGGSYARFWVPVQLS